ncbi:hypothetical protein EGC77_21510 [Shewanella psychromarinicola]|uniref:Uncharacterized protein n=1 Tax=Shewanella psychromarinicola TaxID=2487742 RepID=A0A3N4DAA9_9GAMM|nr:hypothetical protein EGC77_21510 [Shewanella psychromarinicola]
MLDLDVYDYRQEIRDKVIKLGLKAMGLIIFLAKEFLRIEHRIIQIKTDAREILDVLGLYQGL